MASTTESPEATPAAPAEEDEFTVHRARLRGGRVFHRIKPTDNWADQVDTACGKTGYLALGYPGRTPGQCRGCYPPATT